ncbi:MAG: PilZ domain-containing protein, partial [Sedimenticola sp.]|nr:PilZ domain-containing protein [Sedimenticola sp.]
MNQNRRRFKRFMISHPAKLVVDGTEQADCQIGNYSEGGLYLAIDNAALKQIRNGLGSTDSSAINAEVQLFEYPTKRIKYSVPVRFAFESTEGVG